MSKFVKIYQSSNPFEMNLINHAFASSDIPFRISNSGLLQTLGIAGMGINGSGLYVAAEYVDNAKEILKNLFEVEEEVIKDTNYLIEDFLVLCQEGMDEIAEDRKEILRLIALEINKQGQKGHCNIQFICTHNSRRSQIAEFVFRLFTYHFHLNHLHAYSGGTEVTQLNRRVIQALNKYGFQFNNGKLDDLFVYSLIAENEELTQSMYSKLYDDESNPSDSFIAIMVCDHLAESCPIIPGATSRFNLSYKDPKIHDDTPKESDAYKDKVLEIGTEMLYMIQTILG